MLSQLMYILSVLPFPPKSYFKEIEQIIFKFLWRDITDKIKRETTLCPKNLGGLDMMDMVTQAKALKISWVKRLGTAPYNTGWRQLVNIQFGNLAPYIYHNYRVHMFVCVCMCVCLSGLSVCLCT